MGSWKVDTTRWPIVVHSVFGTLTNEQVDEYILEGTRVLDRNEKFVAVMDATHAGMVSAHTRARTLEFQRRHRSQLAAQCLGTVYVLKSPLLRFIVMTVIVVTRIPTPFRVCETLDEALEWAEQQLVRYRAELG